MEFKGIILIANFTVSGFYCSDFFLIFKNSTVMSVSCQIRCQIILMLTPRLTKDIKITFNSDF